MCGYSGPTTPTLSEGEESSLAKAYNEWIAVDCPPPSAEYKPYEPVLSQPQIDWLALNREFS